MATRTDFSGKWQVYKSENFEEFLAANGVNWFIRKMVSMSNPMLEVVQDGDKFEFVYHSVMKDRHEAFTVGEPYEQLQHSGDMTKAMASWEGDKLIVNYEPIEGNHPKPQKMIREMKDGELITTMIVENVEAKRYMKKVE